MTTTDLENTLTKLEQRMLEADARYDAAFFAEHCAGDFLAIGSYGALPKDQVLAMYESGEPNPDRRSEVKDPRVLPLGDQGAALVYTLVSTTSEGTSSWHSTTTYRLTPDGWRIVILHQTPA